MVARRAGSTALFAVVLIAALGAGEDVVAAPRDSAPEPSPAARAAAKSKLVEGADLLKRGEHHEALERFRSAYDLVPSPRIHYNFGVAYMALGRPAEAIESFDKFLAGAIDADPEHVAQAHRHRATLSKKVGRLRVICPVDGATVVVDGRLVGNTPLASAILLDPGSHLLLVEKPAAGSPFTHRLEIRAGSSMEVNARLGAVRAGTESLLPPATTANASPPTPPAVVTGSETPTSPATGDDGPPSWARPAAWVAAGVATASIAFGAYEWSIKETKFKAFNDKANQCDNTSPSPHCRDLRADGNTAKHLGLTGFVAGGALAFGAAGLFLWSTGAFTSIRPQHAAFTCVPNAEAGARCSWRF